MITDLHGLPLVVAVGPANHRDDRAALDLFAQLEALPDARGIVWHHPVVGQADRGYGYCPVLLPLMLQGIYPLIPRAREKTHGCGLGKLRYVVERTLAWFARFRRIDRCFERFQAHLQAFHDLAAALLCLNRTFCVVSHF